MKGRFPDRAVKPLLVLGGVTVAIITGDIPLFLGIVVGVLAATGILIAVLHARLGSAASGPLPV